MGYHRWLGGAAGWGAERAPAHKMGQIGMAMKHHDAQVVFYVSKEQMGHAEELFRNSHTSALMVAESIAMVFDSPVENEDES